MGSFNGGRLVEECLDCPGRPQGEGFNWREIMVQEGRRIMQPGLFFKNRDIQLRN